MNLLNIFVLILPTYLCLALNKNQSDDKSIFDANYIDINTRNGWVRGVIDSNYKIPVHSFRGIPYARPPVGDLRFRKPVKVDNWTGIYLADNYKTMCPQMGILNDENCLYLNIWVPAVNRTKLPVILGIHGGALVMGGSFMFDGTQLVQRGVITVSIGYRLGVLGFLYAGNDDAPGNQGLWDQAMAMEWVRDNIKSFGGNPDDITLIGASAGGWCITLHAVSPITRNYFQKAIIISGASYPKYTVIDRETSFNFTNKYADNLKIFDSEMCPNKTYLVDCLKQKSTYELITGLSNPKIFEGKYFRPIYGDDFMPEHLLSALHHGYFNSNTSYLLGHNELEGVYFTSAQFDLSTAMRYSPAISYSFDANLGNVVDDIANKFVFNLSNKTTREHIARAYTQSIMNNSNYTLKSQNSLLRLAAMHALGDFHITCPTVLFGVNLVKNTLFNGNVFQYRLTYSPSVSFTASSDWSGTTHMEESPLVLGLPFDNIMSKIFSDKDRQMSRGFMDTVTNFAKTGYPTKTKSTNVWPKYHLSSDGTVSAPYIELNPDMKRYHKKYLDPYKGKDGYTSDVINNCINFWDKIYHDEWLN